MKNFADRLVDAIGKKGNPVIVGLDPRINQIPKSISDPIFNEHGKSLQSASRVVLEFNKRVIDIVSPIVVGVKPQIAFYEVFGHHGIDTYIKTVEYAKENGLIVIGDAKRNDIGSTAKAYAQAFLGEVEIDGQKEKVFDVDALTVNAYLGTDGVIPFLEMVKEFGKGIFVLVKTSNPSSSELQDLDCGGDTLYQKMIELVQSWGESSVGESGYSSVGAVVGATYPEVLVGIRERARHMFFLVPGYGAQGATAEDIKGCFNEDKLGAVVNSSRGIIFAYQKEKYKDKFGEDEWEKAVEAAASDMVEEINRTLS